MHGTDFRRSVMTGKETLYVAASLEKDGHRLGTIRAATNVSEVDEALSGIESTVAGLIAVCLMLGLVLGLVRKRPRDRSDIRLVDEKQTERKVA